MYLGLDYGDKRCGIALYIEGIIIPKEIVPRIKLINILKKYIIDYDIKVIVVGLPFDLYGKDLKQLEKTKKMISNLKEIFSDIDIESVDERFTSFEADIALNQMGVSETRGKKDAISASIILETYLKNKKLLGKN